MLWAAAKVSKLIKIFLLKLSIPIPNGFTNSNDFVMELMEKTGLIVTPGSSFGSLGEGFVRFALVLDVPTIQEAVKSVRESGILNR